MPNLVLEYSNSVEERVNIQGLLEDLHQAVLKNGEFESRSVKSRTLRGHHWLIGDVGDSEDFIHISLELVAGFAPEKKRELSNQLMDVLVSQASHIYSLTIDIREMDTNGFNKIIRSTDSRL